MGWTTGQQIDPPEETRVECGECDGVGYIHNDTCFECWGDGLIEPDEYAGQPDTWKEAAL